MKKLIIILLVACSCNNGGSNQKDVKQDSVDKKQDRAIKVLRVNVDTIIASINLPDGEEKTVSIKTLDLKIATLQKALAVLLIRISDAEKKDTLRAAIGEIIIDKKTDGNYVIGVSPVFKNRLKAVELEVAPTIKK